MADAVACPTCGTLLPRAGALCPNCLFTDDGAVSVTQQGDGRRGQLGLASVGRFRVALLFGNAALLLVFLTIMVMNLLIPVPPTRNTPGASPTHAAPVTDSSSGV